MSETYTKKYEVWPPKGDKPGYYRNYKVRVGLKSMNVVQVNENYHDEELSFSVSLDKGVVDGLRIRMSTKSKTILKEVPTTCSCGRPHKEKKQVKVGKDEFIHMSLQREELDKLIDMLVAVREIDWKAKYPGRYGKDKKVLEEDEEYCRSNQLPPVDPEILERIKHG